MAKNAKNCGGSGTNKGSQNQGKQKGQANYKDSGDM